MVYDGDCNFCTCWIHRWKRITGDRVDYLSYQDPQVAAQFPELPITRFEHAVQLITPDGNVYEAAEAVFRSLAFNPHRAWLFNWYSHSPMFARISESSYRLVAGHRKFFSWLTRLLWGRCLEPSSYQLVRSAFLRSLGLIYLIAFISLAGQILGLIGSNGISPVANRIKIITQELDSAKIGVDRYHLLPTFCWWSTRDGFLQFQCAAGIALSVALMAGIAPAPCLFLLWLIYLSLTVAGDIFLGYQWDNLLLETGFLAIFFAPPGFWFHRPLRETQPSAIVLWLLRWLLFRLMFQSGLVKLLSGDPAWRDLTALTYHYETQPLPTWIGWYAHQLPAWVQKSDAAVMFAIELAVPFLIFAPRRPKQFAFLCFLALQLFILLTGNYGFFNLLAIVLCLPLLDDAALQLCIRWRRKQAEPGNASAGNGIRESRNESTGSSDAPKRKWIWPTPVTATLMVIVLFASSIQFGAMCGVPISEASTVASVYNWLAPFRSFNSYGLFAVMTKRRPEIVIEGSNDGMNWKAYGFRYKPGDLKQCPGFVAPHQPRLDWQMWFTALGNRHPWFASFCTRLLQGSPEVLALLEHNPFPKAPPRFIRAVGYRYHFTDLATQRKTGEWWRREYIGLYLPPLSLHETKPNDGMIR